MKVLISERDAWLLTAFVWHQSATGYIKRLDKSCSPARLIGLHRQIMGDPPGLVVDHINGNTSDNRRENLRICTHAENCRNGRMRSHNKLGVKGVYLEKGSYRAQLVVDRKRLRLGTFKTLEEAKAAYVEAANRYHGEFARPE